MPDGHPAALHPSTVLQAGQAGAVRAAASAGFELVGVRLGPAYPTDPTPSLVGEPARVRQVQEAIAGLGLRVLDVEVVRIRPDSRPDDWEPLLELGAELGAAFVLAVSNDPDPSRTASALRALTESAAMRGLGVGVEFMVFSEIRTAAAAAAAVKQAAHPALGIVADPLHLYRGGGRAADVAGLPLLAAQLCDAPDRAPASAEAMAQEARGARLMPGEGALPLSEFLDALPKGLPVSLEVTSAVVEDPVVRARRGRAAMRALGI